MLNIVEHIITSEFEKSIGKDQLRKDVKVGMQLTFPLSLDYDKEDGYRNLDILIFAPMNYVAVLVRERWDVISLSDLEYCEEDQENHIKANSKGYVHSETEWLCAVYHDSCWRDGLHRVLELNKDRIITIDSLIEWYKKIELSDKEIEKMSKVWRNYDEKFYAKLKGVFQFFNKDTNDGYFVIKG